MNFYGRPAAGDPEHRRLVETRDGRANWRRWGPYLADRQWGTVREDYSADGDAWGDQPHDHARSRAYRWGEDGLLGISDERGRLSFALALWNGRDPILKERLFGLTGPEGNHGEDVKEVYAYLDATPTGSYLQGALPLSAGRVPVRRPRRRERAPRSRRTRIRAGRHGDPRRATGSSTSSSNTPRPDRRTSSSGSPPRTAGRRRRRSTCCRRSGSATPGRGVTTRSSPRSAWTRTAGTGRPCSRRTGGWATTGSPSTGEAPWLFTEQRHEHGTALRDAQRDAVREGRLPRGDRRGTGRRRRSRRHRDEGRRARRPGAGPRGDRDGPAPVGARGRRDAVLGRRHGPRRPADRRGRVLHPACRTA